MWAATPAVTAAQASIDSNACIALGASRFSPAERLSFDDGLVPWGFREGTRSWLLPGFPGALMWVKAMSDTGSIGDGDRRPEKGNGPAGDAGPFDARRRCLG